MSNVADALVLLELQYWGSDGKGDKARIEVMGQVLRAFMDTIFLSKVEPGKRSEITTINSQNRNIHLLSYLLYA